MNKKIKNSLKIYCVTTIMLGLCSCVNSGNDSSKNEEPYYFLNSGFENGLLSNWKTTGNAFNDDCIEVISGDNKILNGVGDFYFDGSKASKGSTGTMESSTFTLKGNGKIGFLIGAGKNVSQCYVSLMTSNHEEIASIGNYGFDFDNPNDRMHRVILDGNKYIGSEVYIKVVDNDDGNDGQNYLVLDDFIVNYQGQEEKVGMQYDATRYIEAHKDEILQKYRHTYHLMPPVGWMNDPNGFSYYNNEIHEFYQHTPYSTGWDTMYWGHATSKDFIKWVDQPIALAPDKTYDKNGCFSGNAIEKDNKLYLLYTAVDGEGNQTQALAFSNDGINFTKVNRNPVISSIVIPQGNSKKDFRDPSVFEIDGTYYALMGTKSTDKSGGRILLYSSTNLNDSWKYVGNFFETELTGGGIPECPDYAKIDGKDVLICSPQFMNSDEIDTYQNLHSVTYQIGNADFVNGSFTNDVSEGYMTEFDKGFDFYAAQCMEMPDGRTIMTAWMNMWSRSFPSAATGWTGSMILPRELTVVDNHIYQAPVREIENYRKDKVNYKNQEIKDKLRLNNLSGNRTEIEFTLDVSGLNSDGKAGISLLEGNTHHTDIYYDNQREMVVFDRSNSGISIRSDGGDRFQETRFAKITPNNGKIKLRIFLDVSSIEIFINDGYYTMTGTVFPDENDLDVSFFSENGSARIDELTKYLIEVK